MEGGSHRMVGVTVEEAIQRKEMTEPLNPTSTSSGNISCFSIVLPAYNEEDAIAATVETALNARQFLVQVCGLDEVEVIVVDDGSQDKTPQILSKYKEIRVIQHPTNRGYGAALKTGFANARGDVVGFHDADGTCQTVAFVDLLKAMIEHNADIVIGARTGPGTGMPRTRRLGNVLYAILLSQLSGEPVTDTASGMRILRKDVLESLSPLPDGLNFTPSMTAKALFENLKVVEVPIPYEERIGQSKLNVFRDGIRFLLSILFVVNLYNPLRLLSIAGAAAWVLATLLGLPIVFYYLQHASLQEGFIYRMLAIVFLAYLGTTFFVTGILANSLVDGLGGGTTRRHWIDELVLSRWVRSRLGLLGLLLAAAGTVVQLPSLLQYLLTRSISYHWSHILFGGMLMGIGLQLVIAYYLMQLIETLPLHRPTTRNTRTDSVNRYE